MPERPRPVRSPILGRYCCSRAVSPGSPGGCASATDRIRREPNWRTTMRKLVLMMTLGAILLDAGAAFAGGPPVRPIPNPGTLVLFTTGIVGLAWWLRKRD